MNELIEDIKSLGLKPHMIMMVAGGNPMDPADEDKIAPSLLAGLEAAKKHGVEHVASTSFEEWMKPGAETLTGDAFDAAVTQLVKLHTRVCQDELKTRPKCLAAARECLSNRKSVIVDATNPSSSVRREWINLAREFGAGVRCIQFAVDKDLCFHLNTLRACGPSGSAAGWPPPSGSRASSRPRSSRAIQTQSASRPRAA